jgi:hypothetical protein
MLRLPRKRLVQCKRRNRPQQSFAVAERQSELFGVALSEISERVRVYLVVPEFLLRGSMATIREPLFGREANAAMSARANRQSHSRCFIPNLKKAAGGKNAKTVLKRNSFQKFAYPTLAPLSIIRAISPKLCVRGRSPERRLQSALSHKGCTNSTVTPRV